MNEQNIIRQALEPVIETFHRLQIRYFIGGSVAASYYGLSRTTVDVDLSVELDRSQVEKLVISLQNSHYLSESAIEAALREQSSFNLIHFETAFKVDCFISHRRDFDLIAFERAIEQPLGVAQPLQVRVATAEDVILLKLGWFRLTDETSDRQWGDLLAIAKSRYSELDQTYLRKWAPELGVADLLEKLLEIGKNFAT
ncbi:MAG: hypothetical protein SFX18_14650 [Pirellulales bacterium]|nr:hypothetical protein [Pirellulales bacterium]